MILAKFLCLQFLYLQEGKEVPPTSDENMRKEMDELKDRNTALQEQIGEYSQTIIEQNKASS